MKILVIQQKMIGDVLTSTIICELLKKNIASCEIHYLINSGTEAVVQNNPFVDHIILFKPEFKENKFKFYQFLRSINDYQFDIVIDVYRKVESKLITLFSGASKKISYKKLDSFLFYNRTIPYLKQDHNSDLAIQNRIQLLSPLVDQLPSNISPKIYLNDSEILDANLFLEKHQINKLSPIYMISVLGSSLNKTYPFDYMADVINKIASLGKCQILFNYIPSQKNDVTKIITQCNSLAQSYIKIDAYTTSLRCFLGVLSKCDALIGNEGGAVNMAKALSVPTFAIFSPWIRKEAWALFQNSINRSVHLNDYRKDLFESLSVKQIKENSNELYKSFKPELFEKELELFLEQLD